MKWRVGRDLFPGGASPRVAVAVLPDGKTLLTGSGDTVKL
jgi:hypothetical protein